MTTYIYLLQENEFIDNKLDIYTVGRINLSTLDIHEYFPDNCKLILQLECNNIDKKDIYKIFKEKYIQIKKNGYRYFYGDVNSMKIDLFNLMINNDMKNISNIKCPNNTKRLLLNDMLDIKKVNLLTNNYNFDINYELNELYRKEADMKEDKDIENNNVKNELIYKCEYCKAEYKTNNGLWKHKVKYHNNPKPININNIINNDNNNDNDNSIKCKYCNRKFTRRNNMNVHIQKYCKMKKDVVNILQDKIKRLSVELINAKK